MNSIGSRDVPEGMKRVVRYEKEGQKYVRKETLEEKEWDLSSKMKILLDGLEMAELEAGWEGAGDYADSIKKDVKEFIRRERVEDDYFREKMGHFVRDNYCFCNKKECGLCFVSYLLAEQENMEERKNKLAGEELI